MKGEHSVAAWRLRRVIARCQTAEQKLRHPHCCVDSQRSSLLMSDLRWLDVTKYIWQENPKSHYKIKQGLFWQPYVLFKVFMPLLKLPLNSARTRPHTHNIILLLFRRLHFNWPHGTVFIAITFRQDHRFPSQKVCRCKSTLLFVLSFFFSKIYFF